MQTEEVDDYGDFNTMPIQRSGPPPTSKALNSQPAPATQRALQTPKQQANTVTTKLNAVNAPDDISSLLVLVGISEVIDDPEYQAAARLVLIKYKEQLLEQRENEFIANSGIEILKIHDDSITVKFKSKEYLVPLTPPNLLAREYAEEEASYAELLAMTPQDISTRPRIIEHIFELTATPYIADGKIVSPGLNPALFEQAGFKGDDVLKTINGKRVTVASEFEEIKEELKTASTLKFTVMRRGRLITLYLDIPSETLELRAD